MKNVFKQFRFRKVILALADAFMIAVSSLTTNFLFNGLHQYTYALFSRELFISIMISMICCVGCLIITGAYNRMWRYFKSKDYLSCINGVVLGIGTAFLFIKLANIKVHWVYAVVHGVISIIFICLFRLVFKHTLDRKSVV